MPDSAKQNLLTFFLQHFGRSKAAFSKLFILVASSTTRCRPSLYHFYFLILTDVKGQACSLEFHHSLLTPTEFEKSRTRYLPVAFVVVVVVVGPLLAYLALASLLEIRPRAPLLSLLLIANKMNHRWKRRWQRSISHIAEGRVQKITISDSTNKHESSHGFLNGHIPLLQPRGMMQIRLQLNLRSVKLPTLTSSLYPVL
jgi:hypothetical protein